MTDKHSIADYLSHIGAQVPARSSGWRKMRCPFHDDSTASAAVNFESNRFKCHGCDTAGDTYDLIIKERGGTLSEAIEYAQTISPQSDAAIRTQHRIGGGVPSNTGSLGRRSSSVSSGRGRRGSSWA